MKFKVGDTVLITAGKDKGKQGSIGRVLPSDNQVVVPGMNLYSRHVRQQQGRSGEIIRRERPLATAEVAIINDQGKPDRVGYRLEKDGTKVRVFRRTGQPVPTPRPPKDSTK